METWIWWFVFTTGASGRARDGAGEGYLNTVERRRRRYFEGPSDSPTWRVLSRFRGTAHQRPPCRVAVRCRRVFH